MHKSRTITIIVIALLTVLAVPATRAEIVERIVAVVGDRIILASDLTNQVQMYMLQVGQDAKVDPEQLTGDMLTQMINDELILMAARDDTSITVTAEEIKFELDSHIASLVSRFPSEEAFIRQLAQEGMTKRSLEKRLRPDIRDQLLKQKIVNKKLSEVSLSRQEVEAFYEANLDSLPDVPAKVRLAHILVKFKVSPKTDDSLKTLAESARALALEGLDFADVADRYVADGINAVGGRIGFIRRAEVVPEFGRAAFSLQPGNISGPVRSEYGWHIIKSNARRGDSVDVSQVLFPATPSPADSAWVKAVVDSLYRELENGSDFKELAKLNSEDDASRATGGEMEVMTLEQLRPEFLEPLGTIEVGRFSEPVPSQLGYHILMLLERVPSRRLDINDDFDMLRNFAQQNKSAQIVQEWVEDLRTKIYVDIRNAETAP